MKLRNKKTGEIKDIQTIIHEAFTVHGVEILKNLEANWEDYKPAEPLIKDEKIRKAVRAWAEASDIEAVYLSSEALCWIEGFAKIEFAGNRDWYKELEEGKRYTLAELCGEEQDD